MTEMFLSKISPRQLKLKPVTSDNQYKTQEFIQYDQTRQRLDAEFREKMAKKAAPNTFPKPAVTPRRSSLQFSRENLGGFSPSYSESETERSSRKSVGDIFGERMARKKSESGQGQGQGQGQGLAREISGHSRPIMLRSQTWVEVSGAL